MALTLATFGNPRLLDETGATIAFPDKGLLAAAYIAARPSGRISRIELAGFLWGEEAGNPLVNLRQLLSRARLRQAEMGRAILEVTDSDVAVSTDGLECDFLQLRAIGDDALRIVEMSLAHVTGSFFGGMEVSSDRAELWLAAEQDSVLARFAEALDILSRQDGSRGHQDMLKRAAYRLLEFDPYSEIAYRTLIGAFAAEGQLAQARAMFQRYSDRLQKDLDTAPDTGMLAMRGDIARQAMSRVSALPVDIMLGATTTAVRAVLPRLMLMPPSIAPARNAGLVATSLLEDVTIHLCRARSILLVASHTARRISAMDEPGRLDAYRTCDVSYVLETRLASTTGSDMLFASLISVRDDAVVWAERLPIDPSSLVATYSVIVRRIAAEAVAQIERHEFSRVGRSTSPTAYQNFLIGKHHLHNTELPGIRRARKAFRATLKEAPDFAEALGGLSRTEHLEWLLTARGDMELLAQAERHAQQAIDADGSESSGFQQLGVIKLYRGAFDESVELFETAENNAPSYADLIADHADTLNHSSRFEEALAKINLAFELNPLGPDYYWWVIAGVNYSLRRYETAIDNLTHVADQSNVSRFNAVCWAMLGDTKRARAYMRDTMRNLPDFAIDRWLSLVPIRDPAQREHYREGLRRAGFK